VLLLLLLPPLLSGLKVEEVEEEGKEGKEKLLYYWGNEEYCYCCSFYSTVEAKAAAVAAAVRQTPLSTPVAAAVATHFVLRSTHLKMRGTNTKRKTLTKKLLLSPWQEHEQQQQQPEEGKREWHRGSCSSPSINSSLPLPVPSLRASRLLSFSTPSSSHPTPSSSPAPSRNRM